MALQGSCHCGAIRFEVDAEPPAEVVECNCSYCRRQGRKWWFLPDSQFRLLTDENAVASYFFGAHKIEHHHCGVCGCARSEEHTSELQSLMRISYAVFCLKKKKHI